MYKTKNPFRNSEKDELVNAVRAVLSGQEYRAPEKEVDEHKGDKPHKHPHEAMDPVNQKAVKKKFKDRKDKDIDNDGDVDDSDKFLHKRRKAISKSVSKEEYAENVVHEKWGAGTCIPTMHADPDEDGNIAWYDVMFEHGIETGVPIEELKVTKKGKKEAHDPDDDEDDDDEDEKKKKKNGKKDEVDTEPEIADERSTSESNEKEHTAEGNFFWRVSDGKLASSRIRAKDREEAIRKALRFGLNKSTIKTKGYVKKIGDVKRGRGPDFTKGDSGPADTSPAGKAAYAKAKADRAAFNKKHGVSNDRPRISQMAYTK